MTDFKKIQENTEKREKKAKSRKYFSIFLVSFIVLFFIILAFLNMFNINTVRVNGISSFVPYSEEDVIAFLSIEEGTNLITYDTKGAKRSLMYNFPYIEDITIKRRFPSTLEINILENEGSLYVELGHDVFILSAEGRVLELTDDPFYDGKQRTKLITGGIKRCVCGEDIVFDRKDSIEVIKEITAPLEKHRLFDMITELDTTDKFNVKMVYDGRFDITFGSFEHAESKISMLSQMLESDIWKDSTGSIDVSSGSEAHVKFTGNTAN